VRGGRGKGRTYGKSTQLPRRPGLPHRRNLRHLARDAEHARAGLEIAQRLHVDELVAEQGGAGDGEGSDEGGGRCGLAAVAQHQHGDDDVLGHDQGGLAEGAEGEARADVVGEADEVGGRLEEVAEEGDAGGGARGEQLEDLRHLDDGGGRDDADAQAFGDGELDAGGGAGVDVQQEGLVAFRAQEGDSEVADRGREVVG